MGHLSSIALPTLGNLTKSLGPRVGTFAFFARRNRTNSHHPMCSSVCSVTIKALKALVFIFIQKHYFSPSHYSFSILIDGTSYFAGIVWIV